MPDYQDSWIMGWIKGIFQWYSCENIAHSRQGHLNLRTENTLNRRWSWEVIDEAVSSDSKSGMIEKY